MTDQPDPSVGRGDDSPLFSLVSGEGDGFMLGLAAGDAAGGAWKLGYSAITEQATVISYHLIEHRAILPDELVASLLELDGQPGGEAVLRAESAELRSWLDRAGGGGSAPLARGGVENLVRACPVGAAFRRDADAVIHNSMALSRIFTSDAPGIVIGVLGASAVAAAAFGQSGRDFLTGVSEAVIGATTAIGEDAPGAARLDSLERELHDSVEHVGADTADAVAGIVSANDDDPLELAIAGLLLAAPMGETPHRPVEEAARLGGSALAGFVGAVVGARVGIRAWPWPFANDTWFAEIGRRVVRGPDEIRDLPIPYAVEQHLMSGAPRGFH